MFYLIPYFLFLFSLFLFLRSFLGVLDIGFNVVQHLYIFVLYLVFDA